MYQVSAKYKAAMSQAIQKHTLRGRIGGEDFSAENIISNSLSLNNQICEATAVSLGGVYIGELKLTLETSFALDLFPRGSWTGKTIEIEFGLMLDDLSFEYIPAFGEYAIDSATWSENGLELVAYDNMRKLERELSLDQSSATPLGWLSYVSEICEISIGQTEEEIQLLPNGDKVFGLPENHGLGTFRDLISALASALCSFATIDRSGALILKPLRASEAVDTIAANKRFSGCLFSDFETYYTGLVVTESETGDAIYYTATGVVDDGLTMDLGANPFLQLGSSSAKTEIRQTIIDTLATFRTTPFNSGMLGSIAYDLGDSLLFNGGIAGAGLTACVMSYNANISEYIAQGFGENPALLGAKTEEEKAISAITNNSRDDLINYFSYLNLQTIESAPESEIEIARVAFTATKVATVKINHEFIFEFEGIPDPPTDESISEDIPKEDSSYELRYYLDDDLINYSPCESFPLDAFGERIMTRDFFYLLESVPPNERHTWKVKLVTHGANVRLEPKAVHVTLEGQKLYALKAFDGFIEAADSLALVSLVGLGVDALEDDSSIGISAALMASASDDISRLRIPTVEARALEDAIQVFLQGGFYIQTEDGLNLTTETGDRLITE